MTMRRSINLAFILGLLVVLLIGCGSPAPQGLAPTKAVIGNNPEPLATPEKNNVEVGPNDPQIFMQEPQDGDGVDSPFYLRVGIANFKIPPQYVTIHIAIDAQCTPAGGTIPEDDRHISFPAGKFDNPRFALSLGPHRLCIQAGNQDNIALDGPGMMRVIDLNVESVQEQNND